MVILYVLFLYVVTVMDKIRKHVVQIAIKHISPLNVKHIKCFQFMHQLQSSQKHYVFYFLDQNPRRGQFITFSQYLCSAYVSQTNSAID